MQEVQLSADEQRKFEYYFIEALRLKQNGEYDAALEMFRHCLSIDPTSAVVLYELAHYYILFNQPERAELAFERAVALNPDNYWYKQTLAAFYQRAGKIDKAIAAYEDMTRQFPGRGESLLTLASIYDSRKEYEKEIATLDRIEVKEGKSEMLSMQKLRIYLQLKRFDEAFSEIKGLIAEYPNDSRYKLILSGAYMDNNRMDEARDVLDLILDEEPDNAQAQLLLGTYYQRQGNDSLYNVQLDKALLNARLDTKMRVELMRQIIIEDEQRAGGDTAKILSLFAKTLPLEREKSDLAMLYAGYLTTKNMPEARITEALEDILRIEPDNRAARYQLLGFAAKTNDYKRIVAICEPAVVYNPEMIDFYYFLGIGYFQTDRPDEAIAALQKGVGQVKQDANKNMVSDMYAIIGDIYHQKQQDAMAYAAYDSSLTYNPANIGTLNNYAYYLSLERKDLDKAEEMSYKTVQAEPKNSTYLDTYAWILFEKGRYSEAKLYIDQAMQNGGGDSAAVVEHCGDIYYMTGDKEKALEMWKKAATLPDNESKTLDKKIKQKKYIDR